MIEVIPSITIIDGKITKLKQGDYNIETVYKDSPVDIARQFEDYGVKRIHLIDLDGAKKGSPVNYHILEDIARYTNLHIDFGGGISTDGDISKAYEFGASSVTAASIAVLKKELFSSWLVSYGRDKVTLSADVKEGKVAIKGWQKSSNTNVDDHIDYYYMRGIKYVKSADTAKDGIQEGPNFEHYKHLVNKFPEIHFMASGGVRSVEDIKKLEDIGVKSVIFGRAYFEGNLTLKDLESLVK